MPRPLTSDVTLARLKKEAKRWLKEWHADTGDARARLAEALPNAAADPVLRDMQHAVARELGFPGWTALKRALEAAPPAPGSPESVANRFLDNACPDHHVRGLPDHARAQHTAMRLLRRFPEIARHDFYTTVVCGDLAGVTRALERNPSLATTRSPLSPYRAMGGGSGDLYQDLGPKGWDPLLYLCFTRLPLDAVHENAIAIARLLLDHGADPNAYFKAGGSRYTPLVGVIGEGEENRPAHSRRDELVRLLLDRGAEPYDNQVLYDMGFNADYLWYLPLIYERSLLLGRKADWADPEWRMLSMGPYGTGARWQLEHAIRNNDLKLVEWCLQHGANPNSLPAADQRFPQHMLYDVAVRMGLDDMAELLVRHGATRVPIQREPIATFVAACLRNDRAEVQRQVSKHPEYQRLPDALFEAVRRDRAAVVEMLLDLGMSPNVEDADKVRPLHVAAYENAVAAARVLLARGAEVDAVERNYDNTPLGAAVYYENREMIDLLSEHSRDVWALTYLGRIDRLRALFAEDAQRARIRSGDAIPLMWLPPHDERLALAIAKLFVEHGADVTARYADGLTAADRADALGMPEVAAYLRAGTRQ
jgi:ankyrin repeat protein